MKHKMIKQIESIGEYLADWVKKIYIYVYKHMSV